VSESSRVGESRQPERKGIQGVAGGGGDLLAGGRGRSQAPPAPLAAEPSKSSMGNTGLKVVFGELEVARWGGGIDAVETYLHGHRRESFRLGFWSYVNALQATLKEQLLADPETPFPVIDVMGGKFRVRPYGIGSKQLGIGEKVPFPITLEGCGYNLHLVDIETKGTCLAKFEMSGTQCLYWGDPVARLDEARRVLDDWGLVVHRDQLFRIDDCFDTTFDVPGLLRELELAGHRLGSEKFGDPRRSPSPRGVPEGLTCYFGDRSGPKKALARFYRKWPALHAHETKPGERDSLGRAIAERMGYPEGSELPPQSSRCEIQYGGTFLRNHWGKGGGGTLEGAVTRMHEVTTHYLENRVWFANQPVTEAAKQSGNLSKYNHHPAWSWIVDRWSMVNRSASSDRNSAERVRRQKGMPGGHAKALVDFFNAAERLVSFTPQERDYASKEDARAQAMAYLEFWPISFQRIEARRKAYGTAEQREEAGLPPVELQRDEAGNLEGGTIVGPRAFDPYRIDQAVRHLQNLQLQLPLEGPTDVPF
jgi:hypothetical protein